MLVLSHLASGQGHSSRSPAKSSVAQDTVDNDGEVAEIVEKLLEESFPELADKSFELEFFKSRDVFFHSEPDVGSVLNPFRPTSYQLGVNRAVYSKELPSKAAKAIMAHELSHTLEYVNRGVLGMLDAFVGRFYMPHLIHNERQTDMEAISRGFADGLSDYREWIYPHLTPEDEVKKRKIYFSPEEISAIEDIRTTKPQLFERFRKKPPKNLEEIQKAAAEHR